MFEYQEQTDYEVMDECFAVVSNRCGNGVFLTLDNGKRAFAYRFGNLFPGDRVICRIEKPAAQGKEILASISSVCGYHMRAA